MSKKRVHHRWVRESCPSCLGIGIVQTQFIDRNGYIEPVRYYECEQCKGTGRVNVALPKKEEKKR